MKFSFGGGSIVLGGTAFLPTVDIVKNPTGGVGKGKGAKNTKTPNTPPAVPTPEIPVGEKPVNRAAQFSPAQQKSEDEKIAQSVATPASPRDFQGLQVGHDTTIDYEDQSYPQVELSDPLLRNLSPFMFRVEPPLVFGEDGGFQNQTVGGPAPDFSAMAGTSLTGYDQARRALAQSGISGLKGTSTSVQGALVTNNGQGRSKGARTSQGEVEGAVRGSQAAIADVYTAVDIAMQLAAVLQAPPLVLLINPTTMSINHTKVGQHTDRSRHGYIYQTWGEGQPKMSLSAKCGAFVSGSRGVSYASKRDSVAWQNLMNAFHFYKNNGYIYDTVGKSNAHHFVGSLSIQYDGWKYFGHLESLNWTVDDEHMHGGIEFSMEFTVSARVDLAQSTYAVAPMKSPVPSLSDPRYAGMQNNATGAAGEYALGLDGVTTQGRTVTAGDAFNTLVPQNGASVFMPGNSTQKAWKTPDATQIGTGGFQQAPATISPGQRPLKV